MTCFTHSRHAMQDDFLDYLDDMGTTSSACDQNSVLLAQAVLSVLRRRMVFGLQVDHPPAEAQERILTRILRDRDLHLTQSDIADLARMDKRRS